MESVILQILGVSLALSSIVIAIIIYFRMRSEKEPCWAYETHGIAWIDKEYSTILKLTYKKQTLVDRLCATRILFWNIGKDTINSLDIATPFQLQPTGRANILQHRVLKVSRDVIEFQTSKQVDSVLLSFKFLGNNDGAYIEIIHTGHTDTQFTLNGALTVNYKPPRHRRKLPKNFMAFPNWMFSTGLILILGSLLGAAYAVVKLGIYEPEVQIYGFFILFVLFLLPVALMLKLLDILYKRFRRFPDWIYEE